MEGICYLLRPVIDSESKDETLRNLLLSCADQRAFTKCSGGLSSFVGVINGKLNEPASRYDGLILLQTFLPQCSVEVLTQNAHSWIQQCLKGAASGRTAQLSFIVFKMLLNLSESVPELSRHVSSIVVSNFAELIHQGISSHAYINALECLELCMKKFNGPCGPHRKVIENFLLSLLDYTGSNQMQVLWQAARCMALVPQIGGGGVGGTQYKLAWAARQKQLCRTIHLILDELYSDTNELQVSLMGGMLEGTDPLPLPQIEDADPVLQTQKLVTRLISVSGCLQAMLVMAYPVPKNVSVSSIMNLICRGLAVNGSSIGVSNTTHSLALTAELPKVHQSLLKLLEAIIILCRNNLLSYASSICRLSIQTLKWTRVEEWPYGSEKPFKHLRVQAYRILKLWCGTTKGASGVENVTQQFMDVSLNDIFTEKDSVSLSAGLRKKNNQRRSKGNKGAASPGGAMLRDGLTLNESANKDVCVAALEAATSLVMAASSKIQASVHKSLQETVVTVLLKASMNAGESLIPYKEPSARLQLYRLLLQLVLDPHAVWPAPTNIALKMFANGLNDPDAQISMFCGMAQGVLEKIIHPAYPSLYVTPSHKEIDSCIETAPQDSVTATPGLLNRNLASTTLAEVDQDLTDAASLTPFSKPGRNSRLNSAQSSPVLSGSQPAQLASKVSMSKLTHVLVNSTEQSTPDLEDQKPPELKEKVRADSSGKEDNGSQKAIDLTNSDISDDEIAEVPCEINLADSEDEKMATDDERSNVSICSQATVNTPVVTKIEAKASDKMQSPLKKSPALKEAEVHEAEATNGVSEVNKSWTVGVSEETDGTARTLAINGTSKADNDDGMMEEEGSARKKAKLDEDEMEFPLDEDSMLLSFVDVTRDEENEGDL